MHPNLGISTRMPIDLRHSATEPGGAAENRLSGMATPCDERSTLTIKGGPQRRFVTIVVQDF